MAKRTLEEIPVEEKMALKAQYMHAPLDAEFEKEVIAIYYDCSLSLLQSWRSHGGGPPFKKVGRTILYVKQDVINHFSKKHSSTADYQRAS